jgi:hypothetical protein
MEGNAGDAQQLPGDTGVMVHLDGQQPASAHPTAIWAQLPPPRRQRLQRLLAELMTRSVTTQMAQPREGRHDHFPA